MCSPVTDTCSCEIEIGRSAYLKVWYVVNKRWIIHRIMTIWKYCINLCSTLVNHFSTNQFPKCLIQYMCGLHLNNAQDNLYLNKSDNYLKLSKGYPVMPINLAFPESFTFCRAGSVWLMTMSRLSANSMSCTLTHINIQFINTVIYNQILMKRRCV